MGNSSSQENKARCSKHVGQWHVDVSGDAKRSSSSLLLKTTQLNKELHQPLLEPSSQDTAIQQDRVTLPSVLEINDLIKKKRLEEAYHHLVSFQERVKMEKKSSEDTLQLDNNIKDLNLLYQGLRDEIKCVVKDSINQPSGSTELLVNVGQIIQEEEKREGDLGSTGWNWRDTWKEAVQEGVQAKIQSIPLDSKEENKSWLAVHLGLLGKAVLEDLEKVKNQLKGSYPPDFNVFNTYVQSYQKGIAEHLKKVPLKDLEAKDCYVLLKWIMRDYKSEKMMGSVTLQPDMSPSNISLSLEDSFLDQIKDKYCDMIQNEFKTTLENLIEIERNQMWGSTEPETMPTYYHSEVHVDVCQGMEGYIKNIQETGPQLSRRVVCICLQELKPFPASRLEEAFEQWCTSTPCEDAPGSHASQFKYRTAYINSFILIKEYLEMYRETSPQQVEHLMEAMEDTIKKLGETMMNQFEKEIEPSFKKLMTKRWLKETRDFQEIMEKIEDLSHLCARMKPPYVKTFVSKAHYLVVLKYISQLMNSSLSCKSSEHKKAAYLIKENLNKLQSAFTNLNSSLDWLLPIGDHLSDIIAKKTPQDVKNCLQDLLSDFPDISRKHVAAVLNFQGTMGCKQTLRILDHFREQQNRTTSPANQDRCFFSKIHVNRKKCCCIPVT
ncbi:exocyst complex component 3-like protein 4 isoform X1 [Arapaima gigas]